MALKATRTTGPLAPPCMDYSVAELWLQLSCGFNSRVVSALLLQLSGNLNVRRDLISRRARGELLACQIQQLCVGANFVIRP